MENNPNFLKKKYPGLNMSSEVSSAAKRRNAKLEDLPLSQEYPENRIQNYLDRLGEIFKNENQELKERQVELLKHKLYSKFVIKPSDIPESYFKSIIQRHIDEGYGEPEITEEYRRELAQSLAADQKDSMDLWLDYLSSSEAKYPDWLKYFAMRSVLRMGGLNRNKIKFDDRTGSTVAPFPSLNREALAIVLNAFENQEKGETIYVNEGTDPEVCKKFIKSISDKNFANAYAIAVEVFKPISNELLQNTDGEWRVYKGEEQATNLVESISHHGTGWCLRGLEMTKRYLRGNESLHIYYSLDKYGASSVPRVLMVENKELELTEVRGVARDEDLDPYIGPVVEAKLGEFPDGKNFNKKVADMKKMSALKAKVDSGELLDKDDLIFLYEVDSRIENFGYRRDPRINEILEKRNPKLDAPVVFGCEPSEVAWSPDVVREETVAYIGPLFQGIFNKDLKYIYTSFPHGRIKQYQVDVLPYDKIKKEIQAPLFASWKDLKPQIESEDVSGVVKLVELSLKELGYDNAVNPREVFDKAKSLGLQLCPAKAGLALARGFKGQALIAMQPLLLRNSRSILELDRGQVNLERFEDDRSFTAEKKLIFRKP